MSVWDVLAPRYSTFANDENGILSSQRRIIQYPDVYFFCPVPCHWELMDLFGAATCARKRKVAKGEADLYTWECYNRISKIDLILFSILRLMQWTCMRAERYIIILNGICAKRKSLLSYSLLMIFARISVHGGVQPTPFVSPTLKKWTMTSNFKSNAPCSHEFHCTKPTNSAKRKRYEINGSNSYIFMANEYSAAAHLSLPIDFHLI